MAKRALVPVMMSVALLGCDANRTAPKADGSSVSSSPVVTTAIDQGHICEVHTWQKDATERTCKTGQKVVFLPQSWGSEQLPIMFTAVNCDLRYAVALTNGGVACIYAGPLAPAHDEAPAAAATASKPHTSAAH